MLQSEALLHKGKKEREDTVKAYDSLASVMKSMLSIYTTRLDPTILPSSVDESCLGFASFTHYASIVGSRAMVMYGTKHMTPMADMANYQPHAVEREMNNGRSFLTYHILGDDGSMTVKADQDVAKNSQIFEDYGDNPNSLYLEAHGFVPFTNPFNCANLLNPPVEDEEVLFILKKLQIVDEKGWCPQGCVASDGELPKSTREGAYYLVAGLAQHKDKLQACKDNLDNRQNIGALCIRWEGSSESVAALVKSAAATTLVSYPTSVEEDKSLLQGGGLSSREALAIRYRLASKEILKSLGEVADEPISDVAAPAKEEEKKEFVESDDSVPLETKVANFNAFIESLNFPTNHLVAYVAGDGMRVGTKASQDITFGTSYIDVPVTAVMSSQTAKTESDQVNEVIERGKARNDDFHTLLFFLMHERFNAKESSFWWPYLALLPTLDEYKGYHPTFMSETKLSGLDGSGVKGRILNNQNKAKKAFESVSNDPSVVEALGAAWTEDNYMWATTILDSRSIWWSGARHLVPLLDLINCQQLPKGSTVHSTVLDAGGKNAVTLAPWNFKKGEQVFENYGQPSHIYFIYHGFVLENNVHDCSLIEARVGPDDAGAKDLEQLKARLVAAGFRSYSVDFCVKEENLREEVDKMAKFVAIRDGKEGLASKGDMIGFFDALLKRYEGRMMGGEEDYADKCIKQIVEKEKEIVVKALEFMKGGEFGAEL